MNEVKKKQKTKLRKVDWSKLSQEDLWENFDLIIDT